MSKILVFNVPAYGHVNPTLPVVGELTARGEQVIYYLPEEFEPQVRRADASFRRVDDSLRFNPPSTPQRMAAFFIRWMADSLKLVPRLIDRVRAEEADYVIYDGLCLWGRALAELLGLPAVVWPLVSDKRALPAKAPDGL